MSVRKITACCGICVLNEDEDYYKCDKCLSPRCTAYQGPTPPSSNVCRKCFDEAKKNNQLEELFPDGQDNKGQWINPITKDAIPAHLM